MRILILFYFLMISTMFSQNQNISQGYIFNGEPYIALNPDDPNHIVVAWMGFEQFGKIAITTRVSFDGGSSWSTKVKIPHENSVYSSADPTMAFDRDGNLFLAYIDFDAPVETADSGAVLIRKSTDGGISWGESYKVTDMMDEPGKKAIDRPWLVIDNFNGDNGNIYITTMNAKGANAPYNPYIHISSDKGKSWRHKYLDTINYLAGQWIAQPVPSPAVSFDGTFHAVYPSYVYSQNPYPQYIHVYSENEGFTFNYTTVYIEKTPFSDSLAKRCWLLICDKSDSQHLAFFNISNVYGDGDVCIWESSDKGITWSDPKRINDDPIANGRMQDLVWADFNENGDLFVTWRDRRNAPDIGFETSSEIWGVVKYKENVDFEKNQRISDSLVPYDTILGATSGNDFQGVRFTGNTIYSVWGSNKNGYLNIWFAKSLLTATSVKEIIFNDINSDFIISPNPASDYLFISGFEVEAEIINALGISIRNVTINSGHRIDVSYLPSGIYFLKTGNIVVKFIKL